MLRAAPRWPTAILDGHCARWPSVVRKSGREDGRSLVEQEDDAGEICHIRWNFRLRGEPAELTSDVEEAFLLAVNSAADRVVPC